MDLVPVPIDCCVETLNSHAQNVEATLRSHSLTAIFVTNALGLLGDLDKVNELCRTRGIILLEDNCESLGSELPAGKAGNFGLASTFSFFVAHHMSTVEGGMVCTDDDRLAEMLPIVRAMAGTATWPPRARLGFGDNTISRTSLRQNTAFTTWATIFVQPR